jgi:hypothetical protein
LHNYSLNKIDDLAAELSFAIAEAQPHKLSVVGFLDNSNAEQLVAMRVISRDKKILVRIML